MALISAFIQGLGMFSDIGIGPSIIQNKRGTEPDFLNTAWTIQLLRGCILFLIGLAAAVPLSKFYGDERLALLLPAVAVNGIISGLTSTRRFSLARDVQLGRITVINLASQVASLAVMIAGAAMFQSVWALVLGGFVATVIKVTASHLLLPGIQNRLRWEPRAVNALLTFGRWIFVSTLLSFCVMQSDRLIFGKIGSIALLGVYSIALNWSQIPSTILRSIFSSVLFPLLSRRHEQGQNIGVAFLRQRRLWLLIAAWQTCLLVALGPLLVATLYDERAVAAGWMIQVLAVGGWFLILESANGTALLAKGLAKWVAAGSFAKLLGIVVLLPIGYHFAGFSGAVVGFAMTELFRYLVSAYAAQRAELSTLKQDLRVSLGCFLGGAAAFVSSSTALTYGRSLDLPSRVGLGVSGAGVALLLSLPWGLAIRHSWLSTRRPIA